MNDPQQYSKYETGYAKPGRSNAAAIEREFGVPIDWWDQDGARFKPGEARE